MWSGMKNIISVWVVVSFLFGGYCYAAVSEIVIAKVGSVEITTFELKREMQRILPFNKTFHGGVSQEKLKEIRQIAFDRLMESAYKVRYALLNKIVLPEGVVAARVDKVRGKFATEDAFHKALRNEGIEDFRASVYRMLLAKKAEDVAINSRAEVTEDELRGFYEKNTFMYQRPIEYRASHILVKVDPSLVGKDREELVVKAQNLAEKAKAGEDFYNLAYYNSDEDTKFVGGDIGYFHSGQTVKEFEEAVKGLAPGEIVGPVETISGFHIIKLTDIHKARQLTFEEVYVKIKNTIEEKKRKRLFTDWMSELKSQVSPEIIHPDLQP